MLRSESCNEKSVWNILTLDWCNVSFVTVSEGPIVLVT